jgi:TatD DNase family protein
MIAYQIGSRLYLNITNKCSCSCDFCVRKLSPGVAGYDLRLEKDPTVEEIISAIGDPRVYSEVVFCGYGEPLIRLDAVKAVARWIKNEGGCVRVNTNGLANLWHGRNVLPELGGLVDALSVSLNAENAEKYFQICHPVLGIESYSALLDFIKESKKHIPKVQVSVVDISEIDVEACGEIAEGLGVGFRVRNYVPEK